jgi:hypothetical protein
MSPIAIDHRGLRNAAFLGEKPGTISQLRDTPIRRNARMAFLLKPGSGEGRDVQPFFDGMAASEFVCSFTPSGEKL